MKTLKKRKWWIWVIVGIIAVVVIGALLGNGKQPAKEVINQQTEEPKNVESNEIQVYGVVKAKKVYNVNVEFPAKIDKVNIDTGAVVKEGDILAELDTEQMVKDYENKKAELNDNERKRLQNLRYERNVYEQVSAKLEIAKDEYISKTKGSLALKLIAIEQAKDDLNKQGDTFEKAKKLLAGSAITEDEYGNIKAEYDRRANNLKSLQADYETSVSAKEREIADLKLSALEHNKAIGDLENQKYNQLKTEIYNLKKQLYENPFLKENKIISNVKRGLVEQMSSDGAFVEKGMKILNIYDLDTVYALAYVPEEFYNNAKVGNKVRVVPVADKKKEYTGTITKVAGLAEKNGDQVQIPVEIKIDNLDDYLIPNLNVDVYLK